MDVIVLVFLHLINYLSSWKKLMILYGVFRVRTDMAERFVLDITKTFLSGSHNSRA